jgi:16S rRNA (cytosine967-C5)-methyltransferase
VTDRTDKAPAGLASRQTAFMVLRRVHERGAWSTTAVRTVLGRSPLAPRDRAFAANLAYETLRWEGTLDWVLGQVLERPLDQVEPAVTDILRMGAWQLLWGDAPDRATVDTAVELARREVGPRATGFVNGVLRGLARRKGTLPWPSQHDDQGLGLTTGYPPWVVAETRRRFGDRARAVLEAGNNPPGLTLRARGNRDALLGELAAAGVDATPGAFAPEAVRAPGVDPAALTAVEEGRATPQDEASMLVVHAVVAGLEPSRLLVCDVAAGPGGKATHLGELGARVVAAEVHPARARLVARAADRLGLSGRVVAVAADGRRPPFHSAAFDAALVDAPCTGLGVSRRRPDVRWRRQPGDPERLGRLQLDLLEAAAQLVRPGGRLVYSVCTWPEAETAAVSRAFLAAHGDRFDALPPSGIVAGTLAAESRPKNDPGIQMDPAAHGVDGMYVCCFRRKV